MDSVKDFINNRAELHTRIPNLSENDWKILNSQYSKEEIKKGLAEYISTASPLFPFRVIQEETVREKFISLCGENIDSFILYPNKQDVVEKYNDYKYPYKQYGLGLIEFGHYYNDISNYFQQENRMSCPSYGFPSPLEIWKDQKLLEKMNWIFWRMGTTTINATNIRGSFRLGAYVATQFKPHVAKVIYDYHNSDIVLDFSMGWGDRLAGFYTSRSSKYYGCDPNPNTFNVYKQQCIAYEKYLGCDNPIIIETKDKYEIKGIKHCVLFNLPAEDIDWKNETGTRGIDCIFTSPPYFSTEIYNKGGEKEENQSWSRYPEYQNWRDGFLFPVLKNTFEVLSPKGFMAINIMDPTVNRIRHKTCDEMVDYVTKDLNGIFYGQLGMRIKQRPKTLNKNELKKHLSSDFIENVWCFGKSDLNFKTEPNTLESILL
jgi:hypothetical protein